MADSGTLATSAQVLLAIGQDAGAAQILEANTNYWILMAEAEMSVEAEYDFVTNYASIDAAFKQYLAMVASHRAAFFGIQQNQGSWQLSITQSKLNVIESIWTAALKILRDKDKLAFLMA